MRVPTPTEAEKILLEAESKNPGPWVAHSRVAAHCAMEIARRCDGLDRGAAYAMGLLHDIGRACGVTDCRHLMDGYTLLSGMGYHAAARICLTHSFPNQCVEAYSGKFDISPEEMGFLRDAIKGFIYDEYDRLIQLADAMASPAGPCYIEKRLVDVALRHGIGEYTLGKWQAFLQLKQHFDEKTGVNIYGLFDIVI